MVKSSLFYLRRIYEVFVNFDCTGNCYFACRSNEKNSDVKHKAGAIVEDEKSWAHLEVSTESFIRYKNDATYWKKIVPYDEDSEIYRFISMDLQMLDNAVREKISCEL